MNAEWMKRNDSPKSVFNPLSFDFKTKCRNEENQEVEYLIRSMEIETFPKYLADVITKDLITAIINDRSLGLPTDQQIKEIKEEIEVNEL